MNVKPILKSNYDQKVEWVKSGIEELYVNKGYIHASCLDPYSLHNHFFRGFENIRRNQKYNTWYKVLDLLTDLTQNEIFKPSNVNRLRDRALVHLRKYQTYQQSFQSQITQTNRGITAINIISDDKLQLKKGQVEVLKSQNYDLFNGKVYRIKTDSQSSLKKSENTLINNDQIEGYKLEELGLTNTSSLAIEISKYQFCTGFGAYTWVKIKDDKSDLFWVSKLMSFFQTVDVDPISPTIQHEAEVKEAKLFTVTGELKLTSILFGERKHESDLHLQLLVGADMAKEVLKMNGKPYIIRYQGMEAEVNGKKVTTYMTANEYMQKIIDWTVQTDVYDLSIGEVTEIYLKLTKPALYAIPKSLEAMRNRMLKISTEQSAHKPRIMIIGNKGTGKTSLLKSLDLNDTFIIDSDDWGSWLTYVIMNKWEDLQSWEKLLTETLDEGELEKLAIEWYHLETKPISTFDHLIRIFYDCVVITPEFKRKVMELKYGYNEHKDGYKTRSIYEYVRDKVQPLFYHYYQKLINHKSLSLRSFSLYLTTLPESIDAKCIIQFCHMPLETNSQPPIDVTLMYKPFMSSICNIMYRQIAKIEKGKTWEEANKDIICDLMLYSYYDDATDLRTAYLSKSDLLLLLNVWRYDGIPNITSLLQEVMHPLGT